MNIKDFFLIAGLIAVFLIIIGFLILIPRIPPSPPNNILSVLQNAVDSPGTLMETPSVLFSKNTTLASSTLAGRMGLDPSQVCLDLGEYRGTEPNFKLLGASEEGTQVILWAGTNDRQVKIAVLCVLSGADLNIDDYSDILTAPENCACLQKESRCCLVQLKHA